VAVIQISKIQVRRGKAEGQGSSLPQLASGELGWAIDTQALYIGNGSVTEGAPAVGNTKILTERSDIFQLANTYTYKNKLIVQTGVSASSPIERSLQDRLDDIVDAKSFGIIGNGSDCSIALQRAIDQLFLNPATQASPNSRVTLVIGPGEYTLSTTIYLPPYTSIKGAGKDKTIFTLSSNTPGFATVNGTAVPGNYSGIEVSSYNNQARYINFDGMTLQTTVNANALLINSCRNSVFSNLRLLGPDPETFQEDENSKAIRLEAQIAAANCTSNVFSDIEVKGFSIASYSDYDITDNYWKNCKIENCKFGITLGTGTTIGLLGQVTGPVNNIIENSIFDNISRHALWVKEGTLNVSRNNKFYSVGNNAGTTANSTHSIIKFESKNNQSILDYFARFAELAYVNAYYNRIFTPLIEGDCAYQLNTNDEVDVYQASIAYRLFKLPANQNASYTIDYFYESTAVDARRHGTLFITFDVVNGNIIVKDDYSYVGDSGFQTNLTLTAVLDDLNFDTTPDSLSIMLTNNTSLDTGFIRFTTKSKQ
tara:strand:+ start:131 stop:1747 length:1617 start_codon:yes stop_codon:yes gene_type:complete